jgi:hypothetical protein
MPKILLNCEVSETMFRSIIELFPNTELTALGNLPVYVNCEDGNTVSENDTARISVIGLSKLSIKQNTLKDVRSNNTNAGE